MTEDLHANALHTPADVRELAVEVIRLNTALALLKTEENAAHVEAVATNAAWLEELERIAAFATRTPALRLDAALCSEAQGEEDVGEVCYLCGEEFDPRESGTATGPLGQGGCCPRCARAYDAGYQQGLRRPRNDARQGEPRSANDSGTLAED